MLTVITVICLLLQLAACILIGWSGFVAFFGLIKKKPEKKLSDLQKKNLRFAVVVCARNEEKVLPILLNSLRKQNYPRKSWHVYILADHCTDGTAEFAKTYPFVTVFEKNDGSCSGKGAVLSWGISKLLSEKSDSFDAMLVFDADNVADINFMQRINEALNSGESIVQGFRIAGKPYRTLITKWYALYWPIYSYIYSYAREKLGFSCFLTGTGFAVKKSVLEEHPWETSSITEDVEYSFQQCLRGGRIAFCVDAVCYDEQPSEFGVMVRQLVRWCTGNYQILAAYISEWLHSFRRQHSAKLFDNLSLLMVGPSSVIMLITTVILFVTNLIRGPGLFLYLQIFMVTAGFVFTAVFVMIMARYEKMPLKQMFPAALTFTVFLWIYTLCSAWSVLFPQKKWTAIRHAGLEEQRRSN